MSNQPRRRGHCIAFCAAREDLSIHEILPLLIGTLIGLRFGALISIWYVWDEVRQQCTVWSGPDDNNMRSIWNHDDELLIKQ